MVWESLYKGGKFLFWPNVILCTCVGRFVKCFLIIHHETTFSLMGDSSVTDISGKTLLLHLSFLKNKMFKCDFELLFSALFHAFTDLRHRQRMEILYLINSIIRSRSSAKARNKVLTASQGLNWSIHSFLNLSIRYKRTSSNVWLVILFLNIGTPPSLLRAREDEQGIFHVFFRRHASHVASTINDFSTKVINVLATSNKTIRPLKRCLVIGWLDSDRGVSSWERWQLRKFTTEYID